MDFDSLISIFGSDRICLTHKDGKEFLGVAGKEVRLSAEVIFSYYDKAKNEFIPIFGHLLKQDKEYYLIALSEENLFKEPEIIIKHKIIKLEKPIIPYLKEITRAWHLSQHKKKVVRRKRRHC